MKQVVHVALAFLTGVTFAHATSFKTGWLQKSRKGYVYFKPYVKVKYDKNIIAIFITSKGKVYKGKCRLKKEAPTCTIVPGKKFESPYNEIRYIILKVKHPFPPEIVKSGTVGEKIEKE